MFPDHTPVVLPEVNGFCNKHTTTDTSCPRPQTNYRQLFIQSYFEPLFKKKKKCQCGISTLS